ncbi:S8 family peptidase [Paenibacillus xylanexedens]|uniref:S8 family peptidase n=1 Tax=Paenibacillus xylanexedens TaxID=528191 RepID=UPI001F1684AC|nr:S8 family peptidase [Paenibacillus xylanexedens]MCF7756356.1 S8 family peptidase [Paenibacillus xylanexedens]
MNVHEKGKDKLSQHLLKYLENDVRSEDQMITVLIKRDTDISPSSFLETDIKKSEAKVLERFESINTDLVQIKASQLNQLLKNPAIKSVTAEQTYHLSLDVASKVVADSNVSIIDTHLDGSGVTIAIIDSGIYPHDDLCTPQNRIVAFYDTFAKKETAPSDDGGHGTHCAGCAAGNGKSKNGKYKGLAYNANLVGVKVFNGPTTSTSTIISGVQWCIDNMEKYGIKVMSLSLGGAAINSAQTDPLCEILRVAQSKGITVVAAAGNHPPGLGKIDSPAIEPEIITVGSTNDFNSVDKNDDKISGFSNVGPTIDGVLKPDIVAPGTNIISLRSPNSEYDVTVPQNRIDDHYCSMSGTSMATPIVAGLAALLIQAKPEASPMEIKQAIVEGAKDIFHDPNKAGKGYASLKGALEKLKVPLNV